MSRRQAVVLTAAVIILAGVFGAVCSAQDVKTFPVTGKALMPDGTPAAGAHVEARSITRETDWKVEATATSGADGKFMMQIPQGSYRICAVSGNLVYLNQSEMIDVEADGSLSKPIEISLEKGCRVEGSVVDTSTGKPLGGVKIMTRDGDITESSESGMWSMVLRKSNHTITAMKDGYWWPIANFTAGGDTVKVKVEIKPGGTIKGRIVDEQGNPISGVRIITETSGSFRTHRTQTDADGWFTLVGQDPDSKTEITTIADGYDYLHEQPVTFPAGQREVQVEFSLKKTPVRTITGRVTRADGSPVEGVTVGYGAGPSWADYTTAKTDKDGRYILDKAGMRRNLVVATGNGLAPVCKQVEADKDAQTDFQMKPGHSVEGCVEDEDGNPLSGVHFNVRMQVAESDARDNLYPIANTVTDKDGKFKLENLPEGFVYAGVYAQGYDNLDNERLKVDRKDYTLVLRKKVPGQICGTVVKDSDGKPVPEFNVRLDFSRRGGRSGGLSPGLHKEGVNFQDTDGKFSIKGLDLKEGYCVVVTAPGYMQASVDPVMVKPVSQENYKEVVVRLRPAGVYEGSVHEAGTGKPIEDVIITAWDTTMLNSITSYNWDMSGTSLKSVSTRTDASGKFKFESMPFTSGAVQLEKQGFARTFLKNIRFSSPLKVSLEKGATITGSIADEQGKVPPDTYLQVYEQELFMQYAGSRTDINPDGSFIVKDLPPGEYFIGQYKGSRATRLVYFELKAGETYHVDWMQRGTVTVEGKVLQNGKPVPKVRVGASSRKPGFNSAGSTETSQDGSYKLTLLKPGKYHFSCQVGEWTDPNKIRTTKTLDLATGKNQVDFNFPYGSISGKLVDKLTGKPLTDTSIQLFVWETHEQWGGNMSLHFWDAEPGWQYENTCKTDKNGSFAIRNLRAGKWMISAELNGKNSCRIPAGVVTLADGEAKSGVVAKVPPTGSAALSIAGMKGLPQGTLIVCVDNYDKVYHPKHDGEKYSMEFENLPVGTMKAVVRSNEYLPAQVTFKVQPDETAKVSVKLTKGPRIVFQPKADSYSINDPASIAFKITTPEGKPVWQSWNGLCWGDIIQNNGPDKPASIVVKPGTYKIKAAVRGNGESWRDESDLTDFSGTVKVTAGRDTIVEIPWEQ